MSDIDESTDVVRAERSLLTVRSVNEFTYCPRLFWFEEVAGIFVDNEHTIEGSAIHRRVDIPGGKLTAPDGDESGVSVWHSRALQLSDLALGVSGKLDVVDEDGDAVMPVDTKKGRSRDGSLWPADEVQLTLQALLLRAKGYRVDRVAAFYRAERRRVTVELTETMVTRAETMVLGARSCREREDAPPPLVDSPKCNGCSLNVVCLPDETNLLSGVYDDEPGHPDDPPDDRERFASEPHVRRVVPARDDALPVYVSSYGMRVGVTGNCLRISGKSEGREVDQEVGLNTISQLNVFGTAQVSTQALQACLRARVPIHWYSGGGYYLGRTIPVESRWVSVRMAQYASHQTPLALRIAGALIADKISNGRTILRRNHPDGSTEGNWNARMKQLTQMVTRVDSPEELLAREGEAAKLYWAEFEKLVMQSNEAWAMKGRNRRPPQDPVNAMLSFAYSILVKDCTTAVMGPGLDPYLGVFHTPHHGRPSMALDLMEPFRPLIADSVVLGMIRRNEVRPEDFQFTGQAVLMKDHTRKTLLQAYERRMDELITHPIFGYRISYRQVLGIQATLLSRALTGELSGMATFRVR